MPIVVPPSVKSQGNKVVVFLTTPPAATTGIPTVTEVNAALFAQCYVIGDFNVTPTQNTGEGPQLLCTTAVETEFGNTNYPATDLQYTYVPQALGTPGSDGNEVYEALEPGAQVTTVVLDGYSGKSSSVSAGDIADVFLMEAGRRRKGRSGDGEYDKVSVTQALRVVGGEPIAEDYKLAA